MLRCRFRRAQPLTLSKQSTVMILGLRGQGAREPQQARKPVKLVQPYQASHTSLPRGQTPDKRHWGGGPGKGSPSKCIFAYLLNKIKLWMCEDG